MPVVTSKDGEKQGLLRAAEMMMVSCRTAPRSGGVDDVDTVLVTGSEKDKIAIEMDKMGDERKIDGFRRDADNVRRSEALFTHAAAVRGLDFEGPSCVFKALDLGIALGSAAKTAGNLNVDNRIMYRAGTAAKRLGYLSTSNVAMGIPISSYGKSIYFDRKWPK
jgi:uncharacterized ferredoxin-like protein